MKPGTLKRWCIFASRDRGAQIAEFAAVVPMLIMMIFGILWFGRAFSIYTTVNHAVRAAAEAAALHAPATSGNTASEEDTIKSQIVDPILLAAHLDPSQEVFHVDPINVTLPSGPLITVYNARLSYPYNFKLNGLTCCPPALTPITLSINISAQAQSKEEN